MIADIVSGNPFLSWIMFYSLEYSLGKGAKIVIVNLKMCNYNSGKLKGAKLYTVNQNEAKLGKCA